MSRPTQKTGTSHGVPVMASVPSTATGETELGDPWVQVSKESGGGGRWGGGGGTVCSQTEGKHRRREQWPRRVGGGGGGGGGRGGFIVRGAHSPEQISLPQTPHTQHTNSPRSTPTNQPTINTSTTGIYLGTIYGGSMELPWLPNPQQTVYTCEASPHLMLSAWVICSCA